jgi:uncharacterized phosphosugar-binding protein
MGLDEVNMQEVCDDCAGSATIWDDGRLYAFGRGHSLDVMRR